MRYIIARQPHECRSCGNPICKGEVCIQGCQLYHHVDCYEKRFGSLALGWVRTTKTVENRMKAESETEAWI